MDPGAGFPVPHLRANAIRFAEATNHAFQDKNLLVSFMESSGGRTSFRFNHQFRYPRDGESRYESTPRLSSAAEEREFPWDSASALMHSLSFAIVESRGDHLFLPEIANSVAHALKLELRDEALVQGARSRLEHLRAHTLCIRDRFNSTIDSHTMVVLPRGPLTGPPGPAMPTEPPVTGREALAAWFYCTAHPATTREGPIATLGDMIRDGGFVGRMLRENCVGLLMQLSCQIRLLANLIEVWLAGKPYELGELMEASLDEYLERARMLA